MRPRNQPSGVHPDQVKEWLNVILLVILYTLGTVIVVTSLALYITRKEPPNITWLTFAAFLFGLIPSLRADEWLLRNRGKRNEGASDN